MYAYVVCLLFGSSMCGIIKVLKRYLYLYKIVLTNISEVADVSICKIAYCIVGGNTIEPRSDKRDLLAIKVKNEIFIEKERPSCCKQLQKI